MENSSPYDYTFNGNDYECIIRITNGVNDIYLKPEAWDNLYIEEDIFDWPMRGSIIIKSPYDTFERTSKEAMVLTGADEKKLIYKFRNDGRDTIYISIYPRDTNPLNLNVGDFPENLWRLELEGVIYDTEDLDHSNITNKIKKLYFWDKTFQMMLEKNVEYSTATVGTNKGKAGLHKLNNVDRALKTGEAIGELLKNDTDFAKHSENYGNPDLWDMGDDENLIFYTSPTNSKFIDDLNYLYDAHTSDISRKYQPCILKLERAEEKMKSKQFSLLSIESYFKKAGVGSPGEYQTEHYFLEEPSQTPALQELVIKKAPLSSETATKTDVKAEDYSKIFNYQLVDFSGSEYASSLHNRFISSFNPKDGQFNIEIKNHKSEKFKEFYLENIKPNVLTRETEDRLPLTRYITEGYNSKYYYSEDETELGRICVGRNKLLKYYLFSNLGITFSLRGMTIRQPGRFFGLSKRTLNDKDYDHKLEGQYFVTNVVHYFSNSERNYSTQMVGIKTHTFQNQNPLQPDDVMLIS